MGKCLGSSAAFNTVLAASLIIITNISNNHSNNCNSKHNSVRKSNKHQYDCDCNTR